MRASAFYFNGASRKGYLKFGRLPGKTVENGGDRKDGVDDSNQDFHGGELLAADGPPNDVAVLGF